MTVRLPLPPKRHCLGVRNEATKQSPLVATVIAKAKPEANPLHDYEIASSLRSRNAETVLFGGHCPPYIEIMYLCTDCQHLCPMKPYSLSNKIISIQFPT